MSANADEVSRQSPVPTSGPEGSDLRSVAHKIEGLLDDDGQFNPNPDQLSRGHPDYDESKDPRAKSPDNDRDDRGRFKKAASDQDPADDTGGQDYVEDDATDITDAIEDDAASDDSNADASDTGDTDEDLATSAGDDAPTEDGETGDIQTLAQLAEALEVTVDQLKDGLTHTFNAADGELTVTLSELEKGYQKDADYRRSTAKLAEDRKDAEAQYAGRMQQFEQQQHMAAYSFQTAEQIVAAELDTPALAELRERDPAEWTARRDEIGQRLNYLRGQRQQAAAAYEQFTNSNLAQLRATEETSLLKAIPDFGKPHRAIARDLMSTLGYEPREIANVFDHRVIQGALELAALRVEVAELRQLKGDAANVVKRVKKDVPKLARPGKQKNAAKGIKRTNVQRLKARARKSGKIDDAARVIETMI